MIKSPHTCKKLTDSTTYFLFMLWPMLPPDADAVPGIFADSLCAFLKPEPTPPS